MTNENIVQLIHKLHDVVQKRKDEYLHVANLETTDAEGKIAFTARAAESLVFLTDLDMMLERVENEHN